MSQPAVLPPAEVQRELMELDGWTFDGRAIHRRFTFDGFPEAVAFVQRLVAGAESADHHPDLEIHYRHVDVTYTTHTAGGVTLLDISGAREAARQAGRT